MAFRIPRSESAQLAARPGMASFGLGRAQERQLKALKDINKEYETQRKSLESLKSLLGGGHGGGLANVSNILSIAGKTIGGNLGGSLGKAAGLLGRFGGAGAAGSLGGALGNAGAAGGLGGALGGALGAAAGPIGLAITAAIAVAKEVKKLAASPFKKLADDMGTVNKALSGLNSTLGPIASGLNLATASLDKFSDKMEFISPVLSGITAGMSEVIKQFQAFLEIAVALAQKASPGTVRRFTIAVEDTAAVVGHRLVPLVELMRIVVRGIGDFLQTALPHPNAIREALAPLSEALNELRPAFAEIAGFIRANFVIALKFLAANLKLAAAALKVLLAPLTALGRLRGAQLETSVGAAARSASFTTPEDYAKQVYLAALTSEGVTPAQRTADNTDQMVDLLRAIRDGLLAVNPAAAAAGAGVEAAAGWLRRAFGAG